MHMNSKRKLYFPAATENIKTVFKLSKTATETNKMLKSVHRYEAMFREGCEDSDNDPRSGQPSTAQHFGRVAKIQN